MKQYLAPFVMGLVQGVVLVVVATVVVTLIGGAATMCLSYPQLVALGLGSVAINWYIARIVNGKRTGGRYARRG